MAIVFMDGMDYVSAAQALTKAVRFFQTITYSQTPRITGTGNSVKFGTDGEWNSPVGLWNNATTVGFGAAWFCGSNQLQTDNVWFINADNGGNQIQINTRPTGVLWVSRNGSQLGVDVPIVLDVWHYIECKVVIASSGGSVIVKIDGNTIFNLTSQNTLGQSGYGASWLRFLSPSSNTFVDDLVMWDTSGSVNNDFMGDCKVYQLAPDANGDVNNFTPSTGSNYQNVDETTPNDDTDYNESSTVNDVDRYSYATLTEPGNIKGVQVNAYYRKTDAYIRSAKIQAMSNTHLSEGSEKFLGDSYKTDSSIFELNPDGSVAWTDTTINAATFGVKIQS